MSNSSKQIDIFAEQDQREKRRAGYVCQCCGLYVKEYRRKFNSNMALALIALYSAGRTGGNWAKYYHMEELMSLRNMKRSGDFAYLVHYGMIEKLPEKRADESERNGFYRITKAGWKFVNQLATAPEYFTMFNGKCTGKEGKEIDIVQAIGNKFNYEELMNS